MLNSHDCADSLITLLVNLLTDDSVVFKSQLIRIDVDPYYKWIDLETNDELLSNNKVLVNYSDKNMFFGCCSSNDLLGYDIKQYLSVIFTFIIYIFFKNNKILKIVIIKVLNLDALWLQFF